MSAECSSFIADTPSGGIKMRCVRREAAFPMEAASCGCYPASRGRLRCGVWCAGPRTAGLRLGGGAPPFLEATGRGGCPHAGTRGPGAIWAERGPACGISPAVSKPHRIVARPLYTHGMAEGIISDPPWSLMGKRAGHRARPFDTVLQWIIDGARAGSLKLCVLESVMSIVAVGRGGQKSDLDGFFVFNHKKEKVRLGRFPLAVT